MKKMMVSFAIGIFLGAAFLTICGPGFRNVIPPPVPDYYLPPIPGLQKDPSSEHEEFRRQALIDLLDNDKMLIRFQISGKRMI